jgi:primosomal protein N'
VVAQQKPLVKITEKKSDKSRYFSSFLLERLAENIAQHRTSILLLNRRGYTGTYYCLNCGAYAKCKKCGKQIGIKKIE